MSRNWKAGTEGRGSESCNHWSSMPSLAEQHQRMESFTASFPVLRLLTSLKMSYEAAKKRAKPYNRIVGG